jgi:hypothetical protein
MFKIAITVLLIAAWHFPTTFFVPGGPPNEKGWLVWPFGRQSGPLFDGLQGAIAPSSPVVTSTPTVALVAAGIASLAFLVALASLWGIVVPADFWRPAAIVGGVSSVVLFVIYLGPWAVVPLAVDAVVLWGIFAQGWTHTAVTG